MQQIDDLRSYQKEAIFSIVHAVECDKRNRVLISMPQGTGKSFVLIEAALEIQEKQPREYIYFLAPTTAECLQIENSVTKAISSKNTASFDYSVITYRRFENTVGANLPQTSIVVCFSAERTPNKYSSMELEEKGVCFLGAISSESISHGWFQDVAPVFVYSLSDAVYDGVLQPLEHPEKRVIAFVGFCTRLLNRIGLQELKKADLPLPYGAREYSPDIVVQNDHTLIIAECKLTREQNTSMQVLHSAVFRLIQTTALIDNARGLLISSGRISEREKGLLFKDHGIVIWDISNLIFLTDGIPDLRKELELLSYYDISGLPSARPYMWETQYPLDQAPSKAKTEEDIGHELIDRLLGCRPGKKDAAIFEELCFDIIKLLFSENFTRLRAQHATRDKLFRFDAICALKDTGSFWEMVRRYYYSQFVIFEFKNYAKPIQQNLIYTTEKYLFRSALRSVAIIISRKGFSESAHSASEGCLKEHSKLVLSINDTDLINMIKLRLSGNNPSDYLVERLEDFLMGIGK